MAIVIGVLIIFTLPQLFLLVWAQPKIATSIDQIEPQQTALIFGARVYRNQVMSDVVLERISAGIGLYQAGKTTQLYISGDNSNNAEATTMAKFAQEQGVQAEAIVIDPEGKNTLISCQHLAANSNPGQKVILVSQQFHLPRAIAMCEHQGLTATGLATNQLELLPTRGPNTSSILRIRLLRFFRETSLTWAYILGLYQQFST